MPEAFYTVIGVSAFRAHFYEILRRVDQGECFTITRYGRPVADLIPAARRCEAAEVSDAAGTPGTGNET